MDKQTENNTQQPEGQNSPQKRTVIETLFSLAKKISSGHRKTQIISLVILLLTLVVISIALNLMSQKEQEEVIVPETYVASPSPSASTDPSLENINQRVQEYNEKLDNMDNYEKCLTNPIVELDISYDEK
jgi:hypothetical protein